jgi:hypothetical protein
MIVMKALNNTGARPAHIVRDLPDAETEEQACGPGTPARLGRVAGRSVVTLNGQCRS